MYFSLNTKFITTPSNIRIKKHNKNFRVKQKLIARRKRV